MKKILYFCGMHYRAAQANKCKNVIATSPEATSDCYGITCSDAQLCPTVCDPMDCRPLGFPVHGILQARILEWIAISFSRGSSLPRD